MPVVWTDRRSGGRAVDRSVYGIVITKFFRMGSLPKRRVLTFSLGSSPVRVDTVEGTSQRSKEKFLLKTFGLYINVLRIRFGVETTLADKIFGWTGRTY